jgi:HlyD family secretion protein
MKISWQKLGIAAAALLLVAGIIGFVYTRGPLAPPRVELARVQQGDLQPAVFGIGTVEARLSYALGPTLAGRVKSVAVDQGDRVQAGQVVAELDPVDLDERIAGATFGVQRAGLAVSAAEAQLREAASREKLAQASAARYRDLVAKHFVSREMAAAKESEAEVTRAGREAVAASLDAARRDVARLGAERDALLRQRANLKLVSPVDGVVVSRDAEPGNTVVAGQAVLRLMNPASLWVRMRIDQGQAGGIAAGQAARIVLRSRQDEVIPGKVARLEILGDSVSEERLVHVAFDAVPANLTLGELAEVTVALPAAKNVLFVPTAAVKQLGQQRGVWRVADGKTRFQPVQSGVATLDGQTRVVSGLQAGDEVIVHSPVTLSQDLRVRR